MKRVLVFDGGADSQVIFGALHQALRFGRNLVQQAPGKAVLRQERDISRALETISEADPIKTGDLLCPGCGRLVMPKDGKARVLKGGGGQIVLNQADVELLQERIDKGPWTGDGAIDMADALDFLSAAAEAKPDDVQPQKN